MKLHHATEQALAYATKKGVKVHTACGDFVEPRHATHEIATCSRPGCQMATAGYQVRQARPQIARRNLDHGGHDKPAAPPVVEPWGGFDVIPESFLR